MVIKYLLGQPVEVFYREERIDSLLPTDPKVEQRIVDMDEKAGTVTVEISRIAHE